MTFIWPKALWLLLVVPFVVHQYVVFLRRPAKSAASYSSIGSIREALGPGRRFRRHVPPGLLLMALVATIVALARPNAVVPLPTYQRTVVLVMDTSLSMRATDVEPRRMTAAQNAAKAFVEQQPRDLRIAIVSFAGSAALAQAPTDDKQALFAAIDRLIPHGYTAIGNGMITSLSALFPDEDIAGQVERRTAGREPAHGRSLDDKRPAEYSEPRVVPPGSYRSGAIILLTDGKRTVGPDPLDVASVAADHGVRVFTVGFGKPSSAAAHVDSSAINLEFDEPPLQAIAQITRGEYFHAPSAEELHKIYGTLSTRFRLEREGTEISAVAVAIAAVLLLVAGMLSLLWFKRLD